MFSFLGGGWGSDPAPAGGRGSTASPAGVVLGPAAADGALAGGGSARLDADAAAATTNRALLVAFVEIGERAKEAYSHGDHAEAHRLYAEALAKAAPVADTPTVRDVVATFRARLEETRAAARQAAQRPAPRARPSQPQAAASDAPVAPAQPADEMEAAVRSLIVPASGVGVRWDDVVGLEDAKRSLWEAVVLPGLNPELFTGLRAPPNGILLYGPPGNGKTYLAQAAAAECQATFFSVSSSSLTSKWHGDSEKLVRALFDVARERAPSVVFLDEMDSVLSARSASESEVARRLKTEFLVKMEGVTSGGSGRVMLLGATNRPFDLDEAVLRRFAVQVHVGLPEPRARAELLRASLQQHRHGLTEAELLDLAGRLQRFSSSDIRNLCREASMVALRELPAAQVVRLSADKLRPITAKDFLGAMQVVQPSVSHKAAEELEEWAKRRRR